MMTALNVSAMALDQSIPTNLIMTLISAIGILVVGIFGVLAAFFIISVVEEIAFRLLIKLVNKNG